MIKGLYIFNGNILTVTPAFFCRNKAFFSLINQFGNIGYFIIFIP